MERENWLKTIYEAHHIAVFRFAYSIVQDTHLAEDVMQDTFLKAHRGFLDYQNRGTERAWLFQIARRTAYDALKKRRREVSCDNTELITLAGPDEHTAETDLSELLRPLTPTDRDIVLLHVVAGLTHQEAAKALGRSVHSVKKRYERALCTLRAQLKEEKT